MLLKFMDCDLDFQIRVYLHTRKNSWIWSVLHSGLRSNKPTYYQQDYDAFISVFSRRSVAIYKRIKNFTTHRLSTNGSVKLEQFWELRKFLFSPPTILYISTLWSQIIMIIRIHFMSIVCNKCKGVEKSTIATVKQLTVLC